MLFKFIPVIILLFLLGCPSGNKSQKEISKRIPVDSTLKEVKELDYRATVEGDSTLLDSAYSLLKQRKVLENFKYDRNGHNIVIAVLSKRDKWKEIIDLLEPHKNQLNDTLSVVLSYSKYHYYLKVGNETEAKKYLQKSLDDLHNKVAANQENTFWIYEIARHVYLLYGLDSTRNYLNTVDSNHFEFISNNKDKAIEILLHDILDQK